MNAPDPSSPVRLDVTEGVATVTLDRPAAMNAVTLSLAVGLEQALLVAGGDPDVRVVVIRGAGGNFCAGGDFEEVQRLRAEGPEALRSLFAAFRGACEGVGSIEQPVIAQETLNFDATGVDATALYFRLGKRHGGRTKARWDQQVENDVFRHHTSHL